MNPKKPDIFRTGPIGDVAVYIEWYRRAMQASEKYKWSDATGNGEGDIEREQRTVESIRNETQRILNDYGEKNVQIIADDWTKLILRESFEKIVVSVISALVINLMLFSGTNIGTLIIWSIITYLINLKVKIKPFTPDERSRYETTINNLEREKTLKIKGKELQISGAILDILIGKKNKDSGKSQ